MTEARLATGADTRGALRGAWPLLRPHWRTMLVATIAGVLATAVSLLGPQALRIAIDDGIVAGDRAVLRNGAIAFLVLSVLTEAANWVFEVLGSRAGERVLQSLRMRVFGRLLHQPLRFFEGYGAGELVARTVNDIQLLTVFVRYTFSQVITATLLLCLGIVTMILTSPLLALVCVVAFPIPVFTMRWFGRVSTPLYSRIAESDAQATQYLSEGLNGVDVAHLTGRFDWQSSRLRATRETFLESAKTSVKAENRAFPLLDFNNHAVTAVVLITGGVLVQRDMATVGTVVACIAYLRLVVQPLTSIGSLVSSMQEARVALARVLSIEALPALPEGTTAEPPSGTLEAEDLGFSYVPGKPVLEGVSFTAAPGRRIAIGGETGAGKTTLSRIVAGLYAPDSGSVRVGGVDIRDLTADARRRTVVMLPQGNHIFSGTVADNLRVAAPEAGDDDLRAAFARLGLESFLEQLPLGLETPVGRGGQLLSSGERQLVALVRLALREPSVVILDESTSLVDPATEARLQQPLARLAQDRVLVVIAHRPATLDAADVAYTMEAGRIMPRNRAS